ncbi:MAG: hypothetical protein MAG795_01254 [Candidatus Woesearchaeota archaeon]|nr:hypothetical protein [Candidatus Woesearchaeota archaeon]
MMHIEKHETIANEDCFAKVEEEDGSTTVRDYKKYWYQIHKYKVLEDVVDEDPVEDYKVEECYT